MTLITWNPEDRNSRIILSQGNLVAEIPTSTEYSVVRATEGRSSGKWYWEVTLDSSARMDTQLFGATTGDTTLSLGSTWSKFTKEKLFQSNGNKVTKGATSAYATAWKAGDVIGVTLDLDSKNISFYKNGDYQGLAFNDLVNEPYYPCIVHYNASKSTASFGATPFQYPVPEGYLPYDYENAGWIYPKKNLVKSKNEIYTIDQDMELVKLVVSLPPSLEDFKEHGLEELSSLVTPQTRVVLPMEKSSELGDGAEYSRKIYPEKYKRKIIKMGKKV